MPTAHYETLGVRDGAPAAEVRRAYLDLARRLHPDRWIDASPDERADVERRMQAINEAWRVLGNPGRRVAYDAVAGGGPNRRRVRRREANGFSTGALFDPTISDRPTSRRGSCAPAVGGARPRARRHLRVHRLRHLRLRRDVRRGRRRASSATAVPPKRRRATPRAPGPSSPRSSRSGMCPAGTEPFQPADRNVALCLASVVCRSCASVEPDHLVLMSPDPEPLVAWYARRARPRGAPAGRSGGANEVPFVSLRVSPTLPHRRHAGRADRRERRPRRARRRRRRPRRAGSVGPLRRSRWARPTCSAPAASGAACTCGIPTATCVELRTYS